MDNKIEQLKAAVFSKQKVLEDIYLKYGHTNLVDYVNTWQVGPWSLNDDFMAMVKALIKKHHNDIAGEILNQLQSTPLVSTIDHLGILHHPFFINSNLIFSFRKNIQYLICLPTAGVSLNNSSWPGSFVRHDEKGRVKRISCFPDRLKTLPVFSAPPITPSFLSHFRKKIMGEALKFNDVIDILFDRQIFNLPSFCEQASVLSSRFWQLIFPEAPKLIYLPLEDLVSDLLAGVVSKNKNHPLHRLVFTQDGWQLLSKYFYGLKGAFGESYGSFLFWGIDEGGRRLQLFREGLRITSKARSSIQQKTSIFSGKNANPIDLELSSEAITLALINKKIYPTTLLCFLTLLYYRVTCLGGFNQVNWLTDIKDKFREALREMGENSLAGEILNIQTDNFAEGNFVFFNQKGRLIKPTGWDIFSLGDKQIYKKYQTLAQNMSLAESIDTLLPEIYKIITPLEERDSKLLQVSDEAITASLKLDAKIKTVWES